MRRVSTSLLSVLLIALPAILNAQGSAYDSELQSLRQITKNRPEFQSSFTACRTHELAAQRTAVAALRQQAQKAMRVSERDSILQIATAHAKLTAEKLEEVCLYWMLEKENGILGGRAFVEKAASLRQLHGSAQLTSRAYSTLASGMRQTSDSVVKQANAGCRMLGQVADSMVRSRRSRASVGDVVTIGLIMGMGKCGEPEGIAIHRVQASAIDALYPNGIADASVLEAKKLSNLPDDVVSLAIKASIPNMDSVLRTPPPSRDSVREARSRKNQSPARINPDSVFEVVDQPVSILPDQAGPKFPDLLRSAGIEGSVHAKFVVRRNGSVELRTLKIIRSDLEAFSDAVRDALGRMKFKPGMKDGVAVDQWVEQTFQFSLNR